MRGYLTGSGWQEYKRDGRVCGIALPAGLEDGARLDPPIFTPATKEEQGHDDEHLASTRWCERVGRRDRRGAARRAASRSTKRRARWAWDARAGARRHEVRVRPRGRRAHADRRGAVARLVALLGSRASTRPAACSRSTSSSCATGSIARAGTTSRRRRRCPTRWCAKTRERYLEAMERLTGEPGVSGDERGDAGRARRCSRSRTRRGAIEFARALRASAARDARLGRHGAASRERRRRGDAGRAVDRLRRAARRPGEDAPPARARADPGAPRERRPTSTALAERELEPIDLVAVTLYPFEERAAALDEAGAVEEIDIGGVALLRAAAKNFARRDRAPRSRRSIARCCAALERGGPTPEQRRAWALRTFARTARYDAAIAAELARRGRAATEAAAASTSWRSSACARCATARTRTSRRRSTRAPASAAALEAWRKGRSSRTTTCSISRRRVTLVGRFERAGVRDREAQRAVRRGGGERPLEACGRRSRPTRSRRSAGSWRSTARSTATTARRSAAQFVECVAAPAFEPAAERGARVEEEPARRAARAADLGGAGSVVELRPLGRWALLAARARRRRRPPWRMRDAARADATTELEALRFAWEVAAAARSNAVAIARGRGSSGSAPARRAASTRSTWR